MVLSSMAGTIRNVNQYLIHKEWKCYFSAATLNVLFFFCSESVSELHTGVFHGDFCLCMHIMTNTPHIHVSIQLSNVSQL